MMRARTANCETNSRLLANADALLAYEMRLAVRFAPLCRGEPSEGGENQIEIRSTMLRVIFFWRRS
jgi:hypothetical protein